MHLHAPAHAPLPSQFRTGAVVGALLSLLGTLTGIYFGLVRPALDNAPGQALWVGGALMGAAVLLCALYLRHVYRGPRSRPRTDDHLG